MARGDTRRSEGPAGLKAAGSAAAVGVLGWLTAHTLNFWFVAHSHFGAASSASRHVHRASAAVAVIAGCLAVAAVVAVAVGAHAKSGAPAVPRHRHTVVQLAVGLSTIAFLGADAVEHAALGLDGTPPVVLLIGIVLHTLLSVGASLFWRDFSAALRVLLRWLLGWALPEAQPARRPARRRCRRRRLWWAYALAGRAPPLR